MKLVLINNYYFCSLNRLNLDLAISDDKDIVNLINTNYFKFLF